MKNIMLITLLLLGVEVVKATQTIHVYVALCDNKYQGIVPVPAKIGNGQDPDANLYWGCGYGVRSFFKLKTTDWKLVKTIYPSNPKILERVLFKHTSKDAYLLADAYDGQFIKTCTEDFLKASNAQNSFTFQYQDKKLFFGGGANLLAYVGHNGLMEFDVNLTFNPKPSTYHKEVIILACYSKQYFSPYIQKSRAYPLLWTTHLMAPETYTLKAAIDGWLLKEGGPKIEERAAQAYNKYQKCGIRGARNLFTTGH